MPSPLLGRFFAYWGHGNHATATEDHLARPWAYNRRARPWIFRKPHLAPFYSSAFRLELRARHDAAADPVYARDLGYSGRRDRRLIALPIMCRWSSISSAERGPTASAA